MFDGIDDFITENIVNWRYLLPTIGIFLSIGVGVNNKGCGIPMFLFFLFWYSMVHMYATL